MEPTGSTTRRAVGWSFLEQASRQGLQFVISMVLARLLAPDDVGIIGLLAIFMAVAQSLVDSGFGQAITRDKTQDDIRDSSVFYFNLAVSLAGMAALWAAAPWIAEFFGKPILVPLTRALSLNLPINALGLVQTALLTKRLDFACLFRASLLSLLLSGPVSIAMAYHGHGVWSLAWQQILANAVRVVALWFFSPWRPRLAFSLEAMRGPFRFGSRMLVSGLIDTSFRYIYQPLIGKLFDAAALGYYTVGMRFASLPAETLTTVVSRVTFPSFATMQNDFGRMRNAMRKTLRVGMLITSPLLLGLLAVAEDLIRVVLSEKWIPSVVMLQLYCLVMLLLPLHNVNLSALLAVGRSGEFLRLEVIKKTLIVVFIVATYRWGVNGLIGGQILLSLVGTYLNSRLIGQAVGYPLGQQLRDVAPALVLSALMVCAVFLVKQIPLPHPGVSLVAQTATGAIVFIALAGRFLSAEMSEIAGILRLPVRVRALLGVRS